MNKCDCLNTCGDDPSLVRRPGIACEFRKAHLRMQIEKKQQHEQLLIDAARYRFFRSCDWFDSDLCAVVSPKKSVIIGSVCPSGVRLDDMIDSLRGEA
jgi:hypothetical protein